MATCLTCGWWDRICKCKGGSVNVNTERWITGYYEHIDRNPIYIYDKAHLKHECEKRGLLAKALMKPKSQGKGYEHK